MKNILEIRNLFPLCGELSGGFEPNCDNPLVAGVNDRLILMNRADIALIDVDPLNPEVVTNITLLSGKQAYSWIGQNRSVEPQATLVKGRYSNNFDHEVIFKVFGDGPAVKKQLNKMVNSDLVAIIQNNYKGNNGDAAFAIYGLQGGLETMELGNPKTDGDSDGAYTVTIRSSEFGREPKLPASWFDTDFATTRDLVDALVLSPVIINISPLAGLAAGGDDFEITGSGFTGAIQVDWVEGVTVTSEPSFTVDSDNTITISASAVLTAGTYSIRVTNANGQGQSYPIVVIS